MQDLIRQLELLIVQELLQDVQKPQYLLRLLLPCLLLTTHVPLLVGGAVRPIPHALPLG
jgi:hypothetical protein